MLEYKVHGTSTKKSKHNRDDERANQIYKLTNYSIINQNDTNLLRLYSRGDNLAEMRFFFAVSFST